MNPNLTSQHACPECGASLENSKVGAPCHACLLQLGLAAWTSGNVPSEVSNAPPISEIPRSLADKFPQLEILHQVGSGGMGDVYCARQKSLNRLVALKVIRPESKKAFEFAKRFAREAQALAQLSHPNIVTVHDFGEAKDVYYFIMEYVDGINLRQMLHGGKLGPRQALEIVPAICDALQYAHDKGIVHRDIKPENILVDTNGRVKIADFGLAKLLDKDTQMPALTQTHQVMGTLHYMAPEQFERPTEVDHRADIYSLGVVIYELLTGELPLGRFAPPSSKSEVGARLDQIVLQTLEKEPTLRYQQASQLKSDMQSAPIHSNAQNSAVVQAADQIGLHRTQAYAPIASPPVKSGPVGPTLTGPIPDGGIIGGLVSAQTYRNIAFLLLSLPLGTFYFVYAVVGLSLGFSTLIIWIGILILLGFFLGMRGLAAFERWLVRGLLNTSIPVQYSNRQVSTPTSPNVIDRLKSLFLSGDVWAAIGYCFLKFPLGIFSFSVTVALIPTAIAFLAAPVMTLIPSVERGMSIGSWDIDHPGEAAPLAILGVVILCLSFQILNGLAWLNAQLAKLCLKRHVR